jgi:hypothetical protein
MDISPPWYLNKTIWMIAVSAIAGSAALAGHTLSPDQQSQLVDALVAVANAVSVISAIAGGVFHAKHVSALTNSSNPPSQKAS